VRRVRLRPLDRAGLVQVADVQGNVLTRWNHLKKRRLGQDPRVSHETQASRPRRDAKLAPSLALVKSGEPTGALPPPSAKDMEKGVLGGITRAALAIVARIGAVRMAVRAGGSSLVNSPAAASEACAGGGGPWILRPLREEGARVRRAARGVAIGWSAQVEWELAANGRGRARRGPRAHAGVCEDASDIVGVGGDLDEAHGAAAARASKDVDREDSTEKPGPRMTGGRGRGLG
jgi:hypothetical protein